MNSLLLAYMYIPVVSSSIYTSLEGCETEEGGNVLEVDRGTTTPTNVTCRISDTTVAIQWRYEDTLLSTCPMISRDGVNSCSSSSSSVFRASRTTPTESHLFITPSSASNAETYISSKTISCGDGLEGSEPDQCVMDYVDPAKGTCTVRLDSSQFPYMLKTECTITEGFSGMGRYYCQFYNIPYDAEEGSSRVNVSSLVPMEENNLSSGGTAKCSYVHAPMADKNDDYSLIGKHTYKVKVFPGRQEITATGTDTFNIVAAVTPTIQCQPPDQYLLEHANVTCNCSTPSTGTPPGRLSWEVQEIGNFLVAATGDWGQTHLEMPVQEFVGFNALYRCELQWLGGWPHATHEVILAVPVEITFSAVEVLELNSATLKCQTRAGRPLPHLTMTSPKGTFLAEKPDDDFQVHVEFTLDRAQCRDAGMYRCNASGGFGGDVIISRMLTVLCIPRRVNDTELKTEYENKPSTVTFNLIAFPAIDRFTFAFLGDSEGNRPVQNFKGISLQASCIESDEIYHFACVITVDNVTSSAAGWYQVSVWNKAGVGKFDFQVIINEDSSSAAVAIGVGVGVSLVVIAALLVFLFLLWRNNWRLPCKKGSKRRSSTYKMEGTG